jgi:gliding motility-associated-like protein
LGLRRKRYQKSFEMKNIFLTALIFISISAFANVTSSFTCSEVKGCSPLVINFTDHSGGNVASWHWDLGNGNTSTEQNPSGTYFTPGIYRVSLVVSDGVERDSSTHTITVFSPPSADFISDRTTACPLDSIHFTNLATPGSAPISHYAWGFGNGIASSDTNTSYRYPQSGIYDLTLVVQDTNGCDGHLTKTAYITIWPKPTAAYTASPLTSCAASQTVDFTNQSLGSGLTYNWVLGDGTFSTALNPSHLYTYGGYKANLIVSNDDGCIDSIKQNIAVIYLKADFIASKTTVCAGESIHFLDQSPMPGNVWYWNFGDGTISDKQNPIKAYSHPGVYSVTFVVKDDICQDSSTKVSYITVTDGFSVGMTADNRNSCTIPFVVNFTSITPAGVSLSWSFGDEATSTATDPTYTYTSSSTFSVSLTAVDSSGCTVVSTIANMINTSKPTVNFICDTIFCPNAPVTFGNETHNAIRYLWNFGDGDTSTLQTPIHRYAAYGLYSVSLTAWDSLGCDSTLVKPSVINVDSTVVGFNVDEKFSMCPPLVSVFSSYANRPDLKYKWDFGDGYTDTAANPTHIYFHPGIYTVKLTGASKYGCTNTLIDSDLIVVEGPSGTFTMNPNTGCIPVDVTFSASPSANTQTVVCDLGDGTLYTDSLNFSYTYSSVSIFHPKFVLTDAIGCSVPYSLDSITTHGIPVINVDDTSICAGQNVQVNLGSDRYQWGQSAANSCDTCAMVVLQPSSTATYTVTAMNQYGCAATDSFKVAVVPIPVLNTPDTIKLCKNASIQINIVNEANTVSWSPATYLSSAASFNPTCTPAASIDYTVTAYNKLGCSATQIVPVMVYGQIPLFVTSDTAVCAGSPVQLGAYVSDTFFHDVTYTWARSPYLSSDDIADPMATVQTVAETFQVTATSGSCPAAVASITVAVHPDASVKLPSDTVISPFTELSITPVYGDLTSYTWSAKGTLSCTDCSTTTIVPTESQIVYLEGKNQYGCMTKDSMLIRIVECNPASIFVPNTFTPNGDGTNDRLYARSKTLAQLEYFRLFNRWGAVVFETRNIAEGWDGTINGRIAEEGVYVYQISGKCDSGYDVATSGTVTLIR